MSRSGTSESQLHEANNRLSTALLVLVALAPIPLGGNRPVFWAMIAAIVAIIALWYGFATRQSQRRLRYPAARIASVAWFAGLLWVWILLQAMPLGVLGIDTATIAPQVIINTSAFSIAPGETLLALMRLSAYCAFFFLALQVSSNRRRAQSIMLFLLAIVLAHAIYAMIALTQLGDTLLFLEKWAYFGAATGTFVNRNSFATFLAMGAIIGAGILIGSMFGQRRLNGTTLDNTGETRLNQMGLGLVWLFLMMTLLVTQSRMGLFVAIAGTAVSALILLPRLNRKNVGTVVVVGLAAVLGVTFVSSFFSQGLIERLGSTERSFDVRLALYQQVLDMALTRPWTGFGAGTFQLAYPLFHTPPVSVDLVWDKAHNSYLTLWSELGFVAGSIPILIFSIIGGRVVRKALADRADCVIPAIAFGCLTANGLHALVDFSLEIQANLYFLLFVLALGLAHTSATRTHPSTGPAAHVQ